MELTFNKNFYNYLGCILFGGRDTNGTVAQIGVAKLGGWGYPTSSGSGNVPCSFTDVAGNAVTSMYFALLSNNLNASLNHSFFVFNDGGQTSMRPITFVCGSGSTAASVNDTALVTPNSNITATIDTGCRDTYNSMIFTVTFSAETEQTLNEVGLQRVVATSSNLAGDKTVLFARGVFDEAITLDANTTKTVQIRLALPTLE